MKILVTGAHFTPAAATIMELKKFSDVEIVYAGRNNTQEGDDIPSVESVEMPKLGVKFVSLITGRLQRTFTIYTIPTLIKVPIGFIQASYIILSEKPDVILSFGGYVALPVVLISWLFSIPIIIHEQSLTFGLTNKICSIFADKIAVSFKESLKGEKYLLTGNPIRKEILENRITKSGKLPKILITGGNQGSHAINVAVEGIVSKLPKIASLIHVTGDNRYKDFERLKDKENDHYKVNKWIGKEWADVLWQSDLVICRGGINTLSELALLGKPALVIPISNKEQEENGRYFERLGLSKTLPQNKLSPENLLTNLKIMLKNLPKLKEEAKRAQNKILPDGAKRLALETMLLQK